MASPINTANDSHRLVRMLANSHSQLTYVFRRINNFGDYKMSNPKISFDGFGKKYFVAVDQINVKTEPGFEDKVHKLVVKEESEEKNVVREDFGVLAGKDGKINVEIEVKKESTFDVFVPKMEEKTEAVEDCVKELMDLVEREDVTDNDGIEEMGMEEVTEDGSDKIDAQDAYLKGFDDDLRPVMNRQVKIVEVEQRVLRRSTRLSRKRSATETVRVSLAKKSRRMVEEEVVDGEMEINAFGPNGSSIRTSAFKSIDWKSPKQATRALLVALFGNEILATHTLTGKCSKKPMLDARKIEDIISVVMEKCRTTKKNVRFAISAKCSDEHRAMKKNQQS